MSFTRMMIVSCLWLIWGSAALCAAQDIGGINGGSGSSNGSQLSPSVVHAIVAKIASSVPSELPASSANITTLTTNEQVRYHIPRSDYDIILSHFEATVQPLAAYQVLFQAYNAVVGDCMAFSKQVPSTGDFSYDDDELVWTYRTLASLFITTKRTGGNDQPVRVSSVKSMLEGLAWLIEQRATRVTGAQFALYENRKFVASGVWNIDPNAFVKVAQTANMVEAEKFKKRVR